jgi:hypothetical protein
MQERYRKLNEDRNVSSPAMPLLPMSVVYYYIADVANCLFGGEVVP